MNLFSASHFPIQIAEFPYVLAASILNDLFQKSRHTRTLSVGDLEVQRPPLMFVHRGPTCLALLAQGNSPK